MSSQSEIEFETGHVWQAISHHVYGSTRGHVAIPTDQIDALTDEDIGRMVRQAVPYARLRVAVEMCEDGLAHWFRTPDEMVAFEQELQYVASLSILNSNERALIATGIEVIESAKEQLRKKLASKSCAAPIPGHIYLIDGIGTPWYKIGFSKTPIIRNRDLGTQGPFKHSIVHTHAVSNMYAAENFWHELFADKRAEGEWFTLDQADIDLFVGAKWGAEGWEL